MNRETWETLILQKLKEIKAIAKEYDKSTDFYLSMVVYDDSVSVNNSHWETKTPLAITKYNVGRIVRI